MLIILVTFVLCKFILLKNNLKAYLEISFKSVYFLTL